MHLEVSQRLDDIRRLCLKHRVRALWLFGSATRSDFDASKSDVDFLVEFAPMTPVERKNSYFGLLEDLHSLFGRQVDLAEPGGLRNPIIKRRIEDSRVPVYAAA